MMMTIKHEAHVVKKYFPIYFNAHIYVRLFGLFFCTPRNLATRELLTILLFLTPMPNHR